MQPTDLAFELCKFLVTNYKGALSQKYGIEESDDGVETLNRIAEKRACLLKGGHLDLEKASGFILDDFRNGRIARITLEKPDEDSNGED